MDDLKRRIEEFNALVETERGKLIDDIRPLFDGLLKAPLTGIRWNQYTPSFNDGEPCIFYANDVYFRHSDVPPEAGDYDDGFVSASSLNPKYDSETSNMGAYTLAVEIERFISSIPDDFMEIMFGDGFQITITAEGLEEEDYDHY